MVHKNRGIYGFLGPVVGPDYYGMVLAPRNSTSFATREHVRANQQNRILHSRGNHEVTQKADSNVSNTVGTPS